MASYDIKKVTWLRLSIEQKALSEVAYERIMSPKSQLVYFDKKPKLSSGYCLQLGQTKVAEVET